VPGGKVIGQLVSGGVLRGDVVWTTDGLRETVIEEHERAMSITLTEKAAKEIKRIMDEQNAEEVAHLRIGVTGGGCSGFSYSLGFDKAFDEAADSSSDQHGVKVVVDKKNALYLDGTTVDFYEELDRRGFTFDNPNAVKSCGCGNSFQA
jgi:iron-sulfur cluster assembly accessory protein